MVSREFAKIKEKHRSTWIYLRQKGVDPDIIPFLNALNKIDFIFSLGGAGSCSNTPKDHDRIGRGYQKRAIISSWDHHFTWVDYHGFCFTVADTSDPRFPILKNGLEKKCKIDVADPASENYMIIGEGDPIRRIILRAYVPSRSRKDETYLTKVWEEGARYLKEFHKQHR